MYRCYTGSLASMPRSARDRLLDAAQALLETSADASALTTRAVCDAAGVRAPTLYHHFGDKDGLVASVLARAAEAFLADKPGAAPPDPAEAFRRLWDLWTDFALDHPALFGLAMRYPEAVFDALGPAGARLGDVLIALRAEDRLHVEAAVAFPAVRAAVYGIAALLADGTDAEVVRRVSAALRDALAGAWIAP